MEKRRTARIGSMYIPVYTVVWLSEYMMMSLKGKSPVISHWVLTVGSRRSFRKYGILRILSNVSCYVKYGSGRAVRRDKTRFDTIYSYVLASRGGRVVRHHNSEVST